jgi:two-component sensor histidine kinase
MQDLLKSQSGLSLFKTFLREGAQERLTLIAALTEMLSLTGCSDAKQFSEMLRRIFSNLNAADNFPQPG